MTTPSPFLANTRYFPTEKNGLQRELNLSYNDIADSLNSKEIAIYTTQQSVTGQIFFSTVSNVPFRATMRQVFTLASIANGTNQIAHGIKLTPTTVFTRIYGTATNPSTAFVPLPYVNVATPADGIQLRILGANIEIITTTANWTAYNAMVIVEFIPN